MSGTVVMLLSDKRCGSTWLERELCRHPSVRHVAYTSHSHNETHFWVKAALGLERDPSGFAGGRWPDSYGSPREALRSLAEDLGRNIPGFEPCGPARAWVLAGWEALCARYARPVFLEKSPHHVHHRAALELLLEWSAQSSCDLKVIGLVRNPMAVMQSAERLFGTPPVERQYGWLEGYRNLEVMRRKLAAADYCQVFYESLVQRTTEEMERLCTFMGVGPMDGIGDTVRPECLHAWREDRGFELDLAPDVRRFALDMGYTAADLSGASVGTISRWRRPVRRAGRLLRRIRGRASKGVRKWF